MKQTMKALMVLLLAGSLLAQEDRYVTLSTTKVRALAMGAAFTAMQDDLGALGWNPAGYDLYREKQGKRLTLFVNPVSPLLAIQKTDQLYTEDSSKGEDILLSLGLLLKSLSLSLRSLDLGVVLAEEHIGMRPGLNRDRVFDFSEIGQNYSHSLIGCLKLADQVSLGANASLISRSGAAPQDDRLRKVAVSYGILLKPEKGLRVGVSLVNLPDTLRSDRIGLERIVDEAVNIGLSYEISGSRLSLDLKNLGEEGQEAVREFHVGFEQEILGHVALRGGWFQKSGGGNVFSAGLGLFDGNKVRDYNVLFAHSNFFVNYAFVYEEAQAIDNRWHLFSFYVRI